MLFAYIYGTATSYDIEQSNLYVLVINLQEDMTTATSNNGAEIFGSSTNSACNSNDSEVVGRV